MVYVATEHDTVFAFDADDDNSANRAPLWKRSFINPSTGITTVSSRHDLDCSDLVPEVGITGTPVIDGTSDTLYDALTTAAPAR